MNGLAGQTGCGGPPRWAGNWVGWVWIWTVTQWCGILIWTERRWLVPQTSDSKCSAEETEGKQHLLFGMRLEDSPSGVGWGK